MKHIKLLYFLVIVAISFTKIVLGQNHEIEGKIISSTTNEPVPYATIYNVNLNKGTLSNLDGYFKLSINSSSDKLRVKFTGFKTYYIQLEPDKSFYTINLEENLQLYEEVIVTPRDKSYLYQLVYACSKSNSNIEKHSKAYYELESFIDKEQIELVEGYYNAQIEGYKLLNLDLKTGRIALKNHENRFFASLESSKAIVMLDLFNGNEYFPITPLELSKRKLKKNFYLNLENKYIDDTNDSVYIIEYKPKDTTGLFFEGKLWLNKTDENIIKINLICKDARRHPFIPLFETDEILSVSFNISQSFKCFENDKAVFNQTDFIYNVNYKKSRNKKDLKYTTVKTNAVLYSFDYSNTFFQPLFSYSSNNISDYLKINSTPYNDFFWSYNDEFSLNDSLNSNERFFTDTNTFTNDNRLKSNNVSESGLLDHPYFGWSRKRINFREQIPDTVPKRNKPKLVVYQYNLAVKFFVDVNAYQDSVNIVTSAIFDPMESYYYVAMDKKTNCFLNMYFDFCEIERQKLEDALIAEKNNSSRMKEIYKTFIEEFKDKSFAYFKDVKRGTNKSKMKKYNALIIDHLGIDNLSIFQPYKDGE